MTAQTDVTADAADITAYLLAFERAGKKRRLAEARELAEDVRQHIEEAQMAGRVWADIRAKLGPPDALARAYAAELLFGDETAEGSGKARARRINFWAMFGLATGGGLLTLIVTSTLVTISFAFGMSAVVLFAVGLPLALGMPLPPDVHYEGAPWVAVALSPLFALGAWAALKGLIAYMRWFGRSLRQSLPGRA
ncbi:MAG: hypothetical protein KJS97_12370 [Alphaproteobacteria bacterium]|nr:hypothetical protein [Alphaproteobacteria bacterium]